MSRLRSTRASSAPAATRGASSAAGPRRPGVLVQSPKSDIYVVMLGIALGAILLASLLMALLLNRYGFSVKVSARSATPQITQMV